MATKIIMTGYPVVHKTRFHELGYWMVEPGCWQVVDLQGHRPSQVGPQYATKAELLANLEAYATEYGCDGANPKPALRNLTDAETATVLCALRNFQVNPSWHGVELCDRLTKHQIDALCDAIGTCGRVKVGA
jgi:hypothetical protein